ncbi:UDP-glucuronosyltransferase 2B1-like [Dunckerocampus dactyliophorus]|uniref:UDP-glucuronosyltransferase 2B1-like n=1 Tax=Dunckerocampus dactyliophorus TaxID=161453 RepID=UPI00240534FC|nr:UDP-glucuronosyltransferase 2B1-like [Dunckerocampus dactyliophorus]
MPMHGSSVFLSCIALLSSWRACCGGKILVVPFEGSHWINMDVMIRALHAQGHSVDVIRANTSWYIKDNMPHYNSITVSVIKGVDYDFVNSVVVNVLAIERGQNPVLTFASLQVEMFRATFSLHAIMSKMASRLLKDGDLMARLKEHQYDLLLTDPAGGTGIILAHALKLPLVYNVRWVTSGEGHQYVAPSPLSYIPMTGSGLSDKMTFFERVKNLLYFSLWKVEYALIIEPQYQAVCTEFFGPKIKYDDLVQAADLWLMRADFVFEFPRPIMPNIIHIGGFQCQPAQPLPDHLEEFVQSSGEYGVIVMSLGTFVNELPSDLADTIAAAFAKLPQKVIWKFQGTKPSTLGNNTLLVDWMPQKDLLGHPKIKLFVAHCGTNGIQEAIYHGVPIVGIPIFFDQYDNLRRLTERGAAVMVTLASLDKDNNFLKAIQEALANPSYRINMQRLSRLHRDQPITPIDNALFWIEFVMRHKGAAHLRTESYKLPWYAYYSVDIVFTFFSTVAVMILLPLVVFRTHVLKTHRK